MSNFVGVTMFVGALLCVYVAYGLGRLFGYARMACRLSQQVDKDDSVPLRGGHVYILSSQRYHELRSRENHYFRYQRRYERQNERLDD